MRHARLVKKLQTNASRTTKTKLSNRTETVALLNKNGRINRDTLRAKTVVIMPVFIEQIKRKVKRRRVEKAKKKASDYSASIFQLIIELL
jgi:hypothetical protein